MRSLQEEFRPEGLKLILGIDRIDYTKGIPERLLAKILKKVGEKK